MKEFTYVALRQKPELKEAAAWFHDKWGSAARSVS